MLLCVIVYLQVDRIIYKGIIVLEIKLVVVILFVVFLQIQFCIDGRELFVCIFFGNDIYYIVYCIRVIQCGYWFFDNFNMFNGGQRGYEFGIYGRKIVGSYVIVFVLMNIINQYQCVIGWYFLDVDFQFFGFICIIFNIYIFY